MATAYSSFLSLLGASLLTLPSTSAMTPTEVLGAPTVPEIAPIEAYFDAATVQTLLNDTKCTGVRFYTMLPAEGSSTGSLVAIGIDESGDELNGGLFATAYRQFDGTEGDRVIIKNLSRSKASDGCVRLSEAGSSAYSASFSKADLQALLAQPGCGGLLVTQERVGEDMSLKLATISMDGGKIVPLGSGAEYERICTDPCPTVCGPDKNYLRMR